MSDEEDEEEAWASYSLLIWTLISIAGIFALILLWASITWNRFGLGVVAFLLGVIVVLGIVLRKGRDRDHWFRKRYLKELKRSPERTFHGEITDQIWNLISGTSYDFGISKWWVSIKGQGHLVHTGTFFRSVPSINQEYSPPDEYHLCAVMELPVKGRHVSLTKGIDFMKVPRKLGLYRYKYGNRYFEDIYCITSVPKDEGQLILTDRTMGYIMENFSNCEVYIGDGALIVSNKISERYLYQSARNPNVQCILFKWNDLMPDKMIGLREIILKDHPPEKTEEMEL